MNRLSIAALALAGALAPAGLALAAPAKAPACPSASFPAFFAAYADSVALQKAYTDYPLAHVLLDHSSEPEPREIKVQLPKAKLTFPLIPPAGARKREGLAFRTDEVSANNAKVMLFKEDTGYQVAYFFRKDGCWKLERKEDRSM
jgi:hypothetical protein